MSNEIISYTGKSKKVKLDKNGIGIIQEEVVGVACIGKTPNITFNSDGSQSICYCKIITAQNGITVFQIDDMPNEEVFILYGYEVKLPNKKYLISNLNEGEVIIIDSFCGDRSLLNVYDIIDSGDDGFHYYGSEAYISGRVGLIPISDDDAQRILRLQSIIRETEDELTKIDQLLFKKNNELKGIYKRIMMK